MVFLSDSDDEGEREFLGNQLELNGGSNGQYGNITILMTMMITTMMITTMMITTMIITTMMTMTMMMMMMGGL